MNLPKSDMRARSSRRLATLLSLGALVGVAASVGCKPKRTRVPALCSFDGLSPEEREAQALDPLTWLSLTSPTVDRQQMQRTGPLMNACGQVIPPAFSQGFDCPGFEPTAQRISTDPVEATDLVMSNAGENRTLLWAATDELVSGEAEGSAALALWTEDSVEVHAAGMLRGYRHGARMRLHQIGGTPVLVLQGERCDAEGKCVPMGQVVPILNKRLAELPLWEAERGCIGRAQFQLDRREEREVGNGIIRRFVLTRSLELTDEGVFITDLLRMDDLRADSPAAEPKPFRKLNARRPLLIDGNRFFLEDEDLWDRSLRDHGQIESGG